MESVDVPPSPCPYCGEVRDMAGKPAGGRPKPGDVAVCIRCEAVARFGPDMRLRMMTYAELAAVRASPLWARVRAYRRVIRQAKRDVRGGP